MFVGVIA